jgi:hypothetical protein
MLNVTTFSGFTTIGQLRAPAQLRGRVASLLVSVLGTAYPLASIVQGAIADVVGLRATMVGGLRDHVDHVLRAAADPTALRRPSRGPAGRSHDLDPVTGASVACL